MLPDFFSFFFFKWWCLFVTFSLFFLQQWISLTIPCEILILYSPNGSPFQLGRIFFKQELIAIGVIDQFFLSFVLFWHISKINVTEFLLLEDLLSSLIILQRQYFLHKIIELNIVFQRCITFFFVILKLTSLASPLFTPVQNFITKRYRNYNLLKALFAVFYHSEVWFNCQIEKKDRVYNGSSMN